LRRPDRLSKAQTFELACPGRQAGGKVLSPPHLPLHGEEPATRIGRLVERGLHDELKGVAYAIVEGVDGRTHHLLFDELELTGDCEQGAIVEVRLYENANGRKRLFLGTRSDLAIEEQVAASGATWLDRQLVAREPIALARMSIAPR
jgi:hypothetical protein